MVVDILAIIQHNKNPDIKQNYQCKPFSTVIPFLYTYQTLFFLLFFYVYYYVHYYYCRKNSQLLITLFSITFDGYALCFVTIKAYSFVLRTEMTLDHWPSIINMTHTAVLGTLFTQPPMRRMHICFTDVFVCFFLLFPSVKKYETTVLGNGWKDFHETFTKR